LRLAAVVGAVIPFFQEDGGFWARETRRERREESEKRFLIFYSTVLHCCTVPWLRLLFFFSPIPLVPILLEWE
jgi:hypothetical protein